MYYDASTTLRGMWHGNPVLTTVILGLPLGFLSLICYSIWCADIMDANEDEPSKRHLRVSMASSARILL
jgi:thioredoxin domain-containing protein 10